VNVRVAKHAGTIAATLATTLGWRAIESRRLGGHPCMLQCDKHGSWDQVPCALSRADSLSKWRLAMRRQLSLAIAVVLALGNAAVLAAGSGVVVEPVELGRSATRLPQQPWRAWGGEIGIRFNHDLLRQFGLELEPGRGAKQVGEYTVYRTADRRGLEFSAPYGTFDQFTGGALESLGGFVIGRGDVRVDLGAFRLQPRAGNALELDLVDAKGTAWFYIDHLMYALDEGDTRLDVPTMDLRIGAPLAEHLGMPSLAGNYIADVRLTANVVQRGKTIQVPDSCANPNWPGSGGGAYVADVSMEAISFAMMRCRQAAAPGSVCNGPGGDNGEVVFAPNSTLRNSNDNNGGGACTADNTCTAEVPWYTKFSGVFPPYGNDQHPYLIWNIYRINAAGQIEQIGRSGVKHAFLTVNSGCAEACGDSHILGRGCGDTYSTGNNDSNNSLGPRSEIVPAKGIWGRCGSIYDTNCDGADDPGTPNGNWDQRLITREEQIEPASNPGALYYAESWYIIRDDINIYNTHGLLRVTPNWNGAQWTLPPSGAMTVGPAINAWVNPTSPGPNASNVELSASEGRVRLAAKVTDLGGGTYRYDYAVMNFDFAREATQGNEPNLRVLSNRGFSAFTASVSAPNVSAITFSDGDSNAANDWTATSTGESITWNAPAGATLDWGTLFLFSFTADATPRTANAVLTVADPGSPSQYEVGAFAAGQPNMFANGFEDP
jgi:hypothetical protein